MVHVGRIQRLTHKMTAERAAVARLHIAELPDSELSAFGYEFLYRFYYGSLLRDPDYFCYVYSVDGDVAGFTAFSTDSRKVCRRALVRSWVGMAGSAAAATLRRLATLATVLKMAGSLFSPMPALADVRAEAMSTAVAGRYRSPEYFRRTGTNISQALYLTIARTLHELGVAKVKGYTRKSNVLVNASLSYLGWKKIAEKNACLWVWDTETAVKRFQSAVA